jgi:hypothetical protein
MRLDPLITPSLTVNYLSAFLLWSSGTLLDCDKKSGTCNWNGPMNVTQNVSDDCAVFNVSPHLSTSIG